jgi:hypothetical protein
MQRLYFGVTGQRFSSHIILGNEFIHRIKRGSCMRLYSKISISTLFSVLFVSLLYAAIPAGYTGTPFSYDTLRGHAQQIPGVIKAVFWDNGGEGVAFHESSNNTDQQGSGSMRKNFAGQQIQADWPVDMQYFELCRDHEETGAQSDTGSWFLGWTFPPEWQKHTVHVNTAGTYYVTFHMAESDSPNIIGLTFNNAKTDSIKNLHKSVPPPDCCGGGCEPWHAWGFFTNVDSVTLDTGLQVLRLDFIMGNWNFDLIRFTLKSQVGANPMTQSSTNFAGLQVTTSQAGNRLAVNYTARKSGPAKIALFDCSGKAVMPCIERTLSAGSHVQTLDMGTIGKGVYFMQVEQNGMKTTSGFMLR